LLFAGAESKNNNPATEASILAECHLDRTIEEVNRTGECSSEGRTIRCSDIGGSTYLIDTRIVRKSSGGISRVSVRVKWNGPLGGGAVVATAICDTRYYGAAAGGGSADNLSLTVTEAR
jgi:hypothetical protein